MRWVSLQECLTNEKLADLNRAILEKYGSLITTPKEAKETIDYAVLNCDDREHVKYVNEALFHGNFYLPQHRWAYYDAFNASFPSREDLKGMKGIVFPGARFSAYEDLPWIKQLTEFIQMVYYEYP